MKITAAASTAVPTDELTPRIIGAIAVTMPSAKLVSTRGAHCLKSGWNRLRSSFWIRLSSGEGFGLAYDALSSGMKRLLAGVRGIARGDHFKGHDGKSRKDFFADKLSMKVRDPGDVQTVSTHPLIRTHPETGRKALYIGGHMHQLEDMSEEESAGLIDYLMKHSTKPEFTCRFRWENGSVAFWDNRCVQHFAVNDYPAETRVMHRITICGDTPY